MPELKVWLGTRKAGPSSSWVSLTPGLTLLLLSRFEYSQHDSGVWVLRYGRESKMRGSYAEENKAH